MAIERLSFPHHLNIQAGIEIQMENLPQQLERIARRFGKHTQRLEEGEYDLTPPVWTKHVYNHTLTVMGSGSGVLRLIPRFPDSTSGWANHEGVQDVRRGGRMIRIPEDQLIAIVAGPNRLSSGICLYELVFYFPGPNPS